MINKLIDGVSFPQIGQGGGRETDLIGIAVFSIFKDETNPMGAVALTNFVEWAFESAGHQFKCSGFSGKDFIAVVCEVPRWQTGIETLRSIAGRSWGAAGVKVSWHDGAELVWRDYYIAGLSGTRPFEDLIAQIHVFREQLAAQAKAIEDYKREIRGRE